MTETSNPDPVPPPGGRMALKIVVALCLFAIVAAIGLAGWAAYSGTRQAGGIGGPFRLTAGDGRAVTDSDFRGRYLLVYFGYAYCPDVCPTTMADLAIALKKMGPDADRVQPLFITVDPKRDSASVLKAYTAQFSPRILGLTGTPEQIASVEKEYSVYAQIHRTGPAPGDYLMDHSSIFYLMAPDGRFDAVIDAGQQGGALAADLLRHMRDGS